MCNHIHYFLLIIFPKKVSTTNMFLEKVQRIVKKVHIHFFENCKTVLSVFLKKLQAIKIVTYKRYQLQKNVRWMMGPTALQKKYF